MSLVTVDHAGLAPPSDWVVRWSHLLQPQCSVLDVACGAGRHIAWLSARGHQVTGVDRDISNAQRLAQPAHLVQADIEADAWPLVHNGHPQTFCGVIVTNYLWRPLLETIVGSVAPGGVLIYETFAHGNETLGRPTRPDFLLRPGELLAACQGLHIIAYEHGSMANPSRIVQRIAALRPLNTVVTASELLCHAL